MGYVERIVDQQLDRAGGAWPARARSIRRAQNLTLAAVAINLVGVVGLNFVVGIYDRRLSVAMGALWLGIGYLAFRQRIYLNRRMIRGC